jgi:putative ABC transport system permease protein
LTITLSFKTAMLRNYFKTSLRNLKRNKTYAAINIVGMALGMACGLLIFMLVKYHLSFDDFHANSDRIYRIVTEQHRDVVSNTVGVPSPLGKAFRDDYDYAEKVARIATEDDMTITVKDGNEIELFREEGGVAIVEPEYFDIFNFPLQQGDMKTALAEPNTAIITERLAKKYFGDENPINKTFQFGDKINAKITGILKDLPKNTDQKTEIFVSYPTLKQYNEWLAGDDAWGGIQSGMNCYVRLRPQISVAQVEKVFPAYVTKHRPTSTNVHHYKLQPLADVHYNADYSGPMPKRNLWVLSFIGVFLLVTACVNFINLATAQALNRAKEVGVRKVLGGVRKQLFWQFIAQTGVITVLALALAVLLTLIVLPYVNTWFSSEVSFNVLNDWQLLLFIPGLVLLVTFLAGSYPGLILAGFQPVVALKGKLSQQHIGGFNTRRALIVTQFALSQALVIGMIIIARQMSYSTNSDLGFEKDAVVMIPIAADYQKGKTIKGEMAQLSGVKDVTMCFAAPASNNTNWHTTPYYDNDPNEQEFRIAVKAADADYLETFGLKLVAGRNLFPADTAQEFIVNEAFARKLNLSSPDKLLGKNFKILGHGEGPIVGVVQDFHDQSFHEEINPIGIFSTPSLYNTYAIKMNAANLSATMAALEKTWKASHPDQLYTYEFLDDDIASFYETESLMLKLIQTFSLLALFIGCLGLYGLVSFMAAQKTKEIGIRKVLGSSAGQILWIFGKEFIRLILVAFVIAAPLAWWLMTHWLADFEFKVPIGAGIFVWALLGTFIVAFATVSFQAVKASLMNPVKSLRSE